MKSFLRFSVFLSALCACVAACQSAQQPDVAWWYDISTEPKGTSVNGIPVHEINENWSRANTLDENAYSRKLNKTELKELSDSGMSSHLDVDLNHDGVAEDVYVGVFSRKDGKSGKFLAVFNGDQVTRLFTETGAPGFSALLYHDGNLRWYKCLQCGDFDTIVWSGKRYFIE